MKYKELYAVHQTIWQNIFDWVFYKGVDYTLITMKYFTINKLFPGLIMKSDCVGCEYVYKATKYHRCRSCFLPKKICKNEFKQLSNKMIKIINNKISYNRISYNIDEILSLIDTIKNCGYADFINLNDETGVTLTWRK